MKKQILVLLLSICIFTMGCGRQEEFPVGTVVSEEISETASLEDITSEESSFNPAPAEEPDSEFESEAESEILPEPEAVPYTYRFVMVGDILLHTRVEESCKQEDGTYDYHSLFRETADDLSAADTAIVNEEVILGGIELGVSGYPAFNAPFEVADALVDSGFDVVCHATNHALDKGSKGLLSCLSSWKEQYPDIHVLGIHDSTEDASDITYLDANGVTVALLNFTYSTNGIPMPADMPYLVDMLTPDSVRASIRKAKEQADFVIVFPHWGTEYRLTPDSYQSKYTKLFLEEGVDLVLGTHPHVIEPIEWVEDEASGHRMLVYYSLGNYVNWTSGTGDGVANRMVGGMADITLSLDETGTPYISDYGVRALVSHVEEGPEMVTVYPLSKYTEELAQKNAIRSQDSAFSYSYCFDLCNTVWGDLWN